MIYASTLRKWILFLSILLSGGVLLVPRVPVLLLIFALYALIPGVTTKLDRRLVPAILLLCVILLLSLLRPGVDMLSLIVRYANFFAALLLLNLYLNQERDALAKDFYPILKWMAIQAILTVILGYTIGFLFMAFEYPGGSIHTLMLLFNYHVMRDDISTAIRPDGFFWEPGVFQIYLNLYLYLALFVFKNLRQSALALASVFSTQSTTGIIIAVLILGTYFFQRLGKGNLRAKFTALVFGVILAIPVALIARQNIIEKFTGELQGSSWAREYDLYTGLNVLAENWLVGIGFEYEQYYGASRRLGYGDTQLKEETILNRGNTNGILFLLYSIGIPLSIPFLIGMFRQTFFRHKILIGFLLLLSLTGESIVYTPIPLFLTFSGLQLRWNRRSIAVPQRVGAI